MITSIEVKLTKSLAEKNS